MSNAPIAQAQARPQAQVRARPHVQAQARPHVQAQARPQAQAQARPATEVPKKIFIVPYRDRAAHKQKFLTQMKQLLLGDTNYRFLFVHQKDARPFNRGAMKNLGFLYIRKCYPQHYQDITFIFNDVDTYPKHAGLLPYDTVEGSVQHYFGYRFALGGIFAIKGGDFEKTGGFPNFWGWGLEDNAIYDRSLAAGLTIDRSVFFPIGHANIVQEFDGYQRMLSKRDSVVYKYETPDDMWALKEVQWQDQADDDFLHVSFFTCNMKADEQIYSSYDIRRGPYIALPKGFNRRVWHMKKIFT